MTPVTVTAKTASGTLRGRIEDGVTVFWGVRYAVCERFAAPRPVPAWDGNGTPWPTTPYPPPGPGTPGRRRGHLRRIARVPGWSGDRRRRPGG